MLVLQRYKRPRKLCFYDAKESEIAQMAYHSIVGIEIRTVMFGQHCKAAFCIAAK